MSTKSDIVRSVIATFGPRSYTLRDIQARVKRRCPEFNLSRAAAILARLRDLGEITSYRKDGCKMCYTTVKLREFVQEPKQEPIGATTLLDVWPIYTTPPTLTGKSRVFRLTGQEDR